MYQCQEITPPYKICTIQSKRVQFLTVEVLHLLSLYMIRAKELVTSVHQINYTNQTNPISSHRCKPFSINNLIEDIHKANVKLSLRSVVVHNRI